MIAATLPLLAAACTERGAGHDRVSTGTQARETGTRREPAAAGGRPAPGRSRDAGAWVGSGAEEPGWRTVTWHRKGPEGRVQATVHPVLPLCRAAGGEASGRGARARSGAAALAAEGVPYQALGLWRLVPEGGDALRGGRWERVPTRPRPARIPCREAVPVETLLGVAPLAAGTYWLLATAAGRLEPTFLFVGPALCNDVALPGPRPAGHVALCALHPGHAEARFVPEPTCRSAGAAHGALAFVRGSGTFGTALRGAGVSPPGDLREAICLARRAVPWPARLTDARQERETFVVTLHRDIVQPSIPGAVVRIAPDADRIEVRILPGE